MTAKQQRLWFVALSVVFLSVAVLLILKAFRENIVFFYTPSEITAKQLSPGQRMRLGGLVMEGSVQRDGKAVRFTVTDGTAQLHVQYGGILPNLFREGQGVVAEGTLISPELFHAERVLAKHDENYMPKDVADKLKATGHWKADGAYGKAAP